MSWQEEGDNLWQSGFSQKNQIVTSQSNKTNYRQGNLHHWKIMYT